MTKEEFINGLSEALAHTAAREVIIRNIEFYRSYIDGEIAKGRSEREVMDELGDPRLIANSIKEAAIGPFSVFLFAGALRLPFLSRSSVARL